MTSKTPTVGCFGLVPINGDIGKFIQFGQWLTVHGFDNYQHAILCVSVDDNGNALVVEAEIGGARLSTYTPDQALWSDLPLTTAQIDAVVTSARHYIGTPYSILDYFAIALHSWHVPVPFLKRYVASTKHMICSQLVDQCYRDAGIKLFTDGRWPGYVTPADLYNRLVGKENSPG